MVCGSFNIQYQSTGVGSLPSLDEIKLERSIRYLFLSIYGTFRDGHVSNIFLQILIKVCGACTSKIITNKQNTS